MSLTLSLDFQYTTSIEKLWSALTDSSKLAKTGISSAPALNGAKYGWSNWCGKLELIVA